jgi:hypothetical protein
MVITITVVPKPTRGALLQTLEEIKGQIAVGALSGDFNFDHCYVATGQSESDHYQCQWSTRSKGK